MITKSCDQCGKAFTSVHRTTCFICKPLEGPNQQWREEVLQRMKEAGIEDDGGCSAVGGMAADLGMYECKTCGVADILPSGVCGHCNTLQTVDTWEHRYRTVLSENARLRELLQTIGNIAKWHSSGYALEICRTVGKELGQ